MIGETSEKIVVPYVKIGKNYFRTDDPALILRNWRRIDVTSATIGAIYGKTIEICDMIAKTVATTARTYGAIWVAEDTAAASRGPDTIEPVETEASTGSMYIKRDRERVINRVPNC